MNIYPEVDRQYEDLLTQIMIHGEDRSDRTGVGTRSIFGTHLRYDLNKGFPLITSKKMFTKGIIAELLWFLNGSTDSQILEDQGVNIWKDWKFKEDQIEYVQSLARTEQRYIRRKGDLGPIYGAQWRFWKGRDGKVHDQIAEVIRLIHEDPMSRRILVSAWNVGELDQMALAPCHYSFQFYVGVDQKLSCSFSMRSIDAVLGYPFNVASYALLTHMVAQQCGLNVGDLIFNGGDTHIYQNHFEGVGEQVRREPLPFPELVIRRKPKDIFSYQIEDFEFFNYQSHPAIKYEIAV